MKYLKYFETIIITYKVGDYVVVQGKSTKREFSGKILEITWKFYKLEVYLPADDEFEKMSIFKGNDESIEILRLSNQDEIEEYEMRKNAKKYNL